MPHGLPVVRKLELREHEPGLPTASSTRCMPCAIDFVVTVDPCWTWTAKYSDYRAARLQRIGSTGTSVDRSPLGHVQRQPCRRRRRARASPTSRSCRCWPRRPALEELLEQDRRGMGAPASWAPTIPHGTASTSDRRGRAGHLRRAPTRIYDSQPSSTPTAPCPTPATGKFQLYTDDLGPLPRGGALRGNRRAGGPARRASWPAEVPAGVPASTTTA